MLKQREEEHTCEANKRQKSAGKRRGEKSVSHLVKKEEV